ncbi:MAG: tRNA (guanosine(37)-N1)-methyltransferase TrmD [Bacteroidales bacterium]|nr:tRNA (guanosine(37)-N1)-methyltransferase TrmD [Bacteroidales bacterium]MDY3782830.1 tRNA (guanosine(37)-N1)-methyltransferase TrmD [Candidatus Cryptobacteroides sp.]
MRIDILTVVPQLLESPLSHSIVGRAIRKGLVEIHVHDLRKYGIGPRKNVDDYCYGGDAGMVLMVEPVFRMIEELSADRHYDEIIYMSPDGERLTQGISNSLSLMENIIILCGHYKGIDHRIREHLVTREISVGDYVVSGGEIPAALLADSIIRLIPGALTDETSALSDSFQDGLLSPPQYTRPAEFNGWKVPDVLLSGNPKLIREWQDRQALERTRQLRPELLED